MKPVGPELQSSEVPVPIVVAKKPEPYHLIVQSAYIVLYPYQATGGWCHHGPYMHVYIYVPEALMLL